MFTNGGADRVSMITKKCRGIWHKVPREALWRPLRNSPIHHSMQYTSLLWLVRRHVWLCSSIITQPDTKLINDAPKNYFESHQSRWIELCLHLALRILYWHLHYKPSCRRYSCRDVHTSCHRNIEMRIVRQRMENPGKLCKSLVSWGLRLAGVAR